MPLLEGLDGAQKMSKSLGNYIGINEAPEEMFGKIMSISDMLMWRYYELLSDKNLQEIQAARSGIDSGALHPMDLKKSLAAELVGRFHGTDAAQAAQDYFETRYQKRSVPKDIKKQFSAPESIWICELLADELQFAKSRGEARRLITQGAVKVDGQVITDVNFHFRGGVHQILEVGKNRIATNNSSQFSK
jgi:tyrosyl-tRNA synthetase